jgi:N-acyl-L-homoserine lactone synthetase
MLNHSVFTIDTYTGTQIPAALLKQFGRLRYACFAQDDPYVQMNHQDKIELDHFDTRPTTLHVLVTSKQPKRPKQLVSAIRLIPTVEDYDLEQPSWGYLTQNLTLPKAADVVEGSRWVGKSSRTYEGALSTALLMLQLHQLAQEHGFQQLIGVIAAKSEAWLNKRQTDVYAASHRHNTERDGDILVTTMALDQQFFSAAKNLMLQSMDFGLVKEIAVVRTA